MVVGEDVDQGQLLVVIGHLVLEGEDDGAEHAVLEPAQLVGLHAQGLGLLVGVGHPAELGGELLLDLLELAGQGADRAGGPVGGAHGVEDRSPDALGGEAVEGHAPRLVVAAGRLDQAEGAGRGQLLAVDVAGEVHGDLEDDVAHQRKVLLDQAVNFCFRDGGHVPLHIPWSHPGPSFGPPAVAMSIDHANGSNGPLASSPQRSIEHCTWWHYHRTRLYTQNESDGPPGTRRARQSPDHRSDTKCGRSSCHKHGDGPAGPSPGLARLEGRDPQPVKAAALTPRTDSSASSSRARVEAARPWAPAGMPSSPRTAAVAATAATAPAATPGRSKAP